MKGRSARYSYAFVFICTLCIAIFYCQEWKRLGQVGTLSYDVAGYYMYLPAAFIYDDLKSFSFQDTLESAEIHVGKHHGRWQDNGGFVFQYTAGMAIQYLPFFAIGHAWAKSSKQYPSHGFSPPYQRAIYF